MTHMTIPSVRLLALLTLTLALATAHGCGDEAGTSGGGGGGGGGMAGVGGGGGDGGGGGGGGTTEPDAGGGELTEAEQCIVNADEERGETGECVECMCSNTTCRMALEACYNATDVAEEGPAAGEPRSELCAAVIECGRTSGCTGFGCYGIGGGPCADEIEAAAETTMLGELIDRSEDTDYAVGRANAIGDCSETNCEDECL